MLKCTECHETIYEHPNGHFNDTPQTRCKGPTWNHCRCPGSRALWYHFHDLEQAPIKAAQELQWAKDKEKRDKEHAIQQAEFARQDAATEKMRVLLAQRAAAEAAEKRKVAQLDTQEIGIREKELLLKDRELDRRIRWADSNDERDEESSITEPQGETLADFTVEWDDKVNLAPLPALLKRQDGGTLLYAAKLNWLFGLPSTGKTWVSIIAANEAVLCGGRVLIMDYEDSKATFQRRANLIGLEPALHAGSIIYAAAGLCDSPTARAEAQEWLTGAQDASMSLVVIDSAESSGCPSGGENVNPWIANMVQPWRDVGTGVLVVDHQPKRKEDRPLGPIGSQRKLAAVDGAALECSGLCWTKRKEDRPLGPIGSQRKLAAVDGAALECSGLCWTKKKGGKIILSNHKDRAGDLDSAVGKALAVIVGTYQGEGDDRAFGYTIEKPEQQEDVESLSVQIMDAVIGAGDDGISSRTKLRGMVKGGNGAKDATIEQLIKMGLLHELQHGQARSYIATDEGVQWRIGLE